MRLVARDVENGRRLQTVQNEYSASNFWCLVFRDAVECNTRPKAILRSLFVFSFFFLMAVDERKEFCPVGPQANPICM